jgi:hypothetical protein
MALLGLREMSDLSPQSGPKRTLISLLSPSDLAGATYISDMSCEDSKRARHRQRQARYEARMREGVGLFPTPLRASEIDVLISLNYLPEGAEVDRSRVGEAVAAAIRSLGHR